MEKEFVPYKQALHLKELGFDEPCFRYKNNISDFFEQKAQLFNWNKTECFVSIPTFSQAFKWFRDKHNINNCIIPLIDETGFVYKYQAIIHREESAIEHVGGFETYEEAELACLKKLIEIIKENNKNYV